MLDVLPSGPHSPGVHTLWDFHGIASPGSPETIEQALREAALRCGARVLSTHSHSFGSGAGYTAVALLAESHLTVHTWPEQRFAAIDAFLCGTMRTDEIATVMSDYFRPVRVHLQTIDRCQQLAEIEGVT